MVDFKSMVALYMALNIPEVECVHSTDKHCAKCYWELDKGDETEYGNLKVVKYINYIDESITISVTREDKYHHFIEINTYETVVDFTHYGPIILEESISRFKKELSTHEELEPLVIALETAVLALSTTSGEEDSEAAYTRLEGMIKAGDVSGIEEYLESAYQKASLSNNKSLSTDTGKERILAAISSILSLIKLLKVHQITGVSKELDKIIPVPSLEAQLLSVATRSIGHLMGYSEGRENQEDIEDFLYLFQRTLR